MEYSIILPVLAVIAGFLLCLWGIYRPANKRWEASNAGLAAQLLEFKSENNQLELANREASVQMARLETELNHLRDILERKQTEIKEMEQKLGTLFENIANKVLDSNAVKLQDQHAEKLGNILNPLKERIHNFEQRVNALHDTNVTHTATLTKQIKDLEKMNKSLGEEASRLAAALKGDKKLQGDWGEQQLESILQAAGLTKNIHYRVQKSLRDEADNLLRPDVLVNMPDDKHLIIDSKVSLNAYEAHYNTDDPEQKKKYLHSFVSNLRTHVKGLASKNYQDLYGITPPDYVLMYVPLDASLYLATVEEPGLFEEAIRQKVVLVSNTTLFATLRTISYIWQQDSLNKNTMQIARESGALYDKFVGFMQSMEKLGSKLNSAQSEFDSALNKLSKGRGNLMSKAEKLKRLGLKSNKDMNTDLSASLLDQSDLDDPEEESGETGEDSRKLTD